MRLATMLVAVFAFATPAFAQTKLRVDVYWSGKDPVGSLISFNLKESVAKSARFSLDDKSSQLISIVTLNINDGDGSEGVRSAVSWMFVLGADCKRNNGTTFFYRFTTHGVMVIGRDRAASTAAELLADFSAFVDDTKNDHKTCVLQ
jgi:hypothetical protein